MEKSIDGLQYQADHIECIVQIITKLGKGIKGRLIFDKGNFLSSSCARQAPRMSELWDAGCELKVLRPAKGGFSCMHVKSLIFDAKILLTGSVNMTHNGLENNKEHLFRIPEPDAVSEVLADFEKIWADAEIVTQEMIDDMLTKHTNRATRSRSKSVSREVTRALSSEFEEANDSQR